MRTLVVYSFLELNSNLAYFRKHAGKDFTFLLCKPEEMKAKLSQADPHDYYIFLSSSLCGPFLPLWYRGKKTWIDILTSSLSQETLLQCCEEGGAFATNRKGFLLGLEPFCLDNIQTFSERILEQGFSYTGPHNREKLHPYESIFVKQINPMYPLWHDRARKEPVDLNSSKILVCYTFHEYNDNVKYFLKHGYMEHENIDFIFVVNGRIDNLPKLPGKTIQRENSGYDFAAWSRAIYEDCNFERYESFVFVNSSVRGPFLPSYCELNWVHVYCSHLSPEIGLVGSSVTASKEVKGKYFVQSYAYAMSQRALFFLLQKGFYNANFANMNKIQLIVYCEEQMSYILTSAGMGIKPLHSSHHERDFLISPFAESHDMNFNPAHIRDGYYGMHIHPFEFIFLKYNGNNQHQNKEVEDYTKLYLQ